MTGPISSTPFFYSATLDPPSVPKKRKGEAEEEIPAAKVPKTIQNSPTDSAALTKEDAARREQFFQQFYEIAESSGDKSKKIADLFHNYPELEDPNLQIPFGSCRGATVGWLVALCQDWDWIERWIDTHAIKNINAMPWESSGLTIPWLIANALEIDKTFDDEYQNKEKQQKLTSLLFKINENYDDLNLNATPLLNEREKRLAVMVDDKYPSEKSVIYILASKAESDLLLQLVNKHLYAIDFENAIYGHSDNSVLEELFWANQYAIIAELIRKDAPIDWNKSLLRALKTEEESQYTKPLFTLLVLKGIDIGNFGTSITQDLLSPWDRYLNPYSTAELSTSCAKTHIQLFWTSLLQNPDFNDISPALICKYYQNHMQKSEQHRKATETIVQEGFTEYRQQHDVLAHPCDKLKKAQALSLLRVLLDEIQQRYPGIAFTSPLKEELIRAIGNSQDFKRASLKREMEVCLQRWQEKSPHLFDQMFDQINNCKPPPPASKPIKPRSSENNIFHRVEEERDKFGTEPCRKTFRNIFDDDPEVNPNEICTSGRFKGASVAWLAAYCGNFKRLETWIDAGLIDNIQAKPVKKIGSNLTIGWLAAKYKQWPLLMKMCSLYPNFDINAPLSASLKNSGTTPLWWVARNHPEAEQFFDFLRDQQRYMDLEASDAQGESVAHLLVAKKTLDLFQLLLKDTSLIPPIEDILNCKKLSGSFEGQTVASSIAAKNHGYFMQLASTYPIDCSARAFFPHASITLLNYITTKKEWKLLADLMEKRVPLDFNSKIKTNQNATAEESKDWSETTPFFDLALAKEWTLMHKALESYPGIDCNARQLGVTALNMALQAEQWDLALNMLLATPKPDIHIKPEANNLPTIVELIQGIKDEKLKQSIMAALVVKEITCPELPASMQLHQEIETFAKDLLAIDSVSSQLKRLPSKIQRNLLREFICARYPEFKVVPQHLLDEYVKRLHKRLPDEHQKLIYDTIATSGINRYRQEQDLLEHTYSEFQIEEARELIKRCLREAQAQKVNLKFSSSLRKNIIEQISQSPDFKKNTIQQAVQTAIDEHLSKIAP